MKKCNRLLLCLCSVATISCFAMNNKAKRPLTPDPRAQQLQKGCSNAQCTCTPCTCNPCLCTAESNAPKRSLSPASSQALAAAHKIARDTNHVPNCECHKCADENPRK
jgi:hypothetical protein